MESIFIIPNYIHSTGTYTRAPSVYEVLALEERAKVEDLP